MNICKHLRLAAEREKDVKNDEEKTLKEEKKIVCHDYVQIHLNHNLRWRGESSIEKFEVNEISFRLSITLTSPSAVNLAACDVQQSLGNMSGHGNERSLCDLPDEVLLHILKGLSLESRLEILGCSKRLRRVGTDGYLWQSIVLSPWVAHSTTSILTDGEGTRPAKRNLSNIIGTLLGTVIPRCSLKTLHVRGLGDQFRDSHLMQVARWSPNLEDVDVSDTAVTDAGIMYVFSTVASRSQTIAVLLETGLIPYPVKRMGSGHIDLLDAPDDDQKVETSINNVPPPPPPPPAPIPSIMMHSAQNFPEHPAMSLIDAIQLRAPSLLSSSHGVSLPRSRSTPSVNGHTPADIERLIPLPAQQHNRSESETPPFDVHTNIAITNASTDNMTTTTTPFRCGKIRHLQLCNLRKLTDRSLIRLANGARHLTHLDLSSYTSSSRITDLGLREVIQACRWLECLGLSGCSQITDASWISLSNSPSRSLLRKLDCSGCFQLTDVGVKALLTGCENLEELDLAYCWRVTDACVESLGMLDIVEGGGSSSGRSVGSRENRHDQSFHLSTEFEDVCRTVKMRNMSLMYCYNISDRGVFTIARLMPMLEKLDLAQCTSVSQDARQRLKDVGLVLGDENFDFRMMMDDDDG
ncbi:hypothetical protein HDU76_008694 [Blyttiomyces sp. JEL0837]|nr:hypothetical protein HDU76_008694 [Blyttiomyces sp. JEL0837]